MSATIEKARELLGVRLEELDAEKGRVERARDALNLNGGGPPRRGRPKRRTSTSGRKRRAGGRRGQVLELVIANPGIKGGELAKKMKMKPNYLYRVLGDLVKEGLIEKRGKTYSPGKLTLRG